MMRSSSFAEFLARLEQESQGCLVLTVLRYCQSAGWQHLASLRAKVFWITGPSEFQVRYCPLGHQHLTVQEELTSRKSLLFLERYHWDASCLANVRICCMSWLFWTVGSIAMEETTALVIVVVNGYEPDPSLDLAARWCWNGCKGGRNPQLRGEMAGAPQGPQWDQRRLQGITAWRCVDGSPFLGWEDVPLYKAKVRMWASST